MIGLTHHAIERYQDRIRPDLTLAEAEERLKEMLPGASKLKGRTKYGQLRFQTEDCVLVVKEEEPPARGLVAVTVYPLPFSRGAPTPQEWAMAMERVAQGANRALDAAGVEEEVPTPTKAVAVGAPKGRCGCPLGTVHRCALRPPVVNEDQRLERAMGEVERALSRFTRAQAHHERVEAALRAGVEKARAHGERMQTDREEMKNVLGGLAPFLPDTPEVREVLGERYAFVLDVLARRG